MPMEPHHLCLCHSGSRRTIFKRCFQNPGCRNSPKYHFECMLNLQGTRTPKPIKRQRPSILLPSTMTISIVRQRRSETKTTKSHPLVCHCQNRKATHHRAATRHWTAHHSRNFFHNAIMRVPQDNPSREATDRHPSRPQPQIFQRWKTDRTQ